MNIEWITLIDLSNSPKMKTSVQKHIEFISLILSTNSIFCHSTSFVLPNCIKLQHTYVLYAILRFIHTCDFLNYCVNLNYCMNDFLCSHLLCVVLQFPHYLNRNSIKNSTKWVHNPFLNFKVHTIVEKIAGVNAPT